MAPINKRVTLADVARLAGVSKQTVSRVVNGSQAVTGETRIRVEACIEQLGFRPSLLARQLTTGRSFTLGVVANSGIGYLMSGKAYMDMVREADRMGFSLLVKEVPGHSLEEVTASFDYLIERQVEGVIWAGPEVGDSHAWLDDYDPAQLPMPMVVVNAGLRPGLDTVAFDNLHAGRIATRHLASLGRKHIGHISGPMDRWVSRQRVEGWRQELVALGLEGVHLLVESDWEAGSGGPCLRALQELCPQLDAVFVSSDRTAQGVLFEAHRQGLRVPEDLAVMGIDDLPEAQYFIPPLTSMTQDTPHMAVVALRLLVRRICKLRGEPYPAACATPEDPSLLHTLVVRQSTQGGPF
ncbi:MAG: hypothetical protein CGU29_12885 [Candidatus Dactylopiibacterium carminicum]|uniref:LacI family transcriptional regulator n=1 Tax=Candidatus Dactylopiibacterium carminicum TaxID=857335 RepID=A0A272EPX2_9RHOO|nr:LacI family DNA-binding transcriptional regulator [Candidatus Dactylopiibacterium carminicum]KAF7598405.1 LacI family transcriptional regulator [Candidatus Dactylopiibacterium carminicum]PAS92152.1 MAG: hypothetical protein CGU29_12885 [Candidatus Dactylopiibacterium carminicum]PAS97570.1 MAG: hypothetical protein BSR46_13540 [Candidatus Dactylopiibacterium carminicum]